jgi:hypothetical protein
MILIFSNFDDNYFQACSEATYNSVLNVEALKEAVQQKPSLIVLRATKNGKWEFRYSAHLLIGSLNQPHIVIK